MKLLILGGTRFLGRHLVEAALARNHVITLFNRGTQPSPFPNVETINGDRNHDLSKLANRRWDAVIDTSGYLPRSVTASAKALASAIDTYVFISSVSVYADLTAADIHETAALATLSSEQLDAANALDSSGQTSAVNYGKMYGGLKALCEQAAEDVMPNRALNIRPGLIVGPYDYSDRFTYWVSRIARGGEVLAPGRPGRYVQFIDARDLAEWTITMIERKETGVYNANGLQDSLTMGSVLEKCKTVSGSDANITWVSESFLLEEKVAPWSELPLWVPEEPPPYMKGLISINCDKATAAGLTLRSLDETIGDVLTWIQAEHPREKLIAGLDPAKEQLLLRKWHEFGVR
ncbi:MAG TPA: NAD-dependent epimerase/dehydratase family protein [Pyrinomonadaceae bacterium]|jgi:2'-hydroxyisoflavone reductase